MKASACVLRPAPIRGLHAQVPDIPHHNRDAHPNRRDALAPEAPPPAPEGSDKLCTFLIAFAALAFLARTGRLGTAASLHRRERFGGIIEVIQPSFNRSADVNDWFADIVGVILGIGLGLLYRLRRH